jgi:hypothetical protein
VVTLLARSWRADGIRVLIYLDDWLFLVRPEEVDAVRQRILADCRRAHFAINLEKSALTGSPSLTHLGIHVDLRRNLFSVPEHKRSDITAGITAIYSAGRCSARALSKIAGKISALHAAIGPLTSLFCRALHKTIACAMSWDKPIQLDNDTMDELHYWMTADWSLFVAPIWPIPVPGPTVELFVDASASGWGAWIAAPSYSTSNGFFSLEDRDGSSTLREVLGLLFALRAFVDMLRNHRVRVFTDNQNVPRVQRRGSAVPALGLAAKQLYALTQTEKISLTVEWIPRELNSLADHLSKSPDKDDWQLNPRLFAALDQIWGPHDLDAFASAQNALLPKFWSRSPAPGAAGTDAFEQVWSGLNLWMNPPFGLIGRILAKAAEEKAVATVVVPAWKSRPWWPIIQPRANTWAKFIIDVRPLPKTATTFRPGQSQGNARGTGPVPWQCFALRLDFRRADLH